MTERRKERGKVREYVGRREKDETGEAVAFGRDEKEDQ